MVFFADRTEAGEKLAEKLLDEPLIKETPRDRLLVLSIPRGGVVVGAAIAQALGCAHDVVAVKKIGFPGQEELAIGAMAEDGTVALNPQITGWFEPEEDYIKREKEQVQAKLEAYIRKFRQGRAIDLQSKTVIVVDDGVATGETMKAAVMWLTSREPARQPQRVIVAVPVCSLAAARELAQIADELVCLSMMEWFWAIGQFYWDFDQVSDEEVIEYLSKADEIHRVSDQSG